MKRPLPQRIVLDPEMLKSMKPPPTPEEVELMDRIFQAHDAGLEQAAKVCEAYAAQYEQAIERGEQISLCVAAAAGALAGKIRSQKILMPGGTEPWWRGWVTQDSIDADIRLRRGMDGR